VAGWTLHRPFRRLSRALLRRRNVFSLSNELNDTAVYHFFMDMALKEARRADRLGEVPIGAVVVLPLSSPRTFEVLGRASNLVETNRDASAHAEMLSLRQACQRVGNWRLLNATLYSTLEPCPMCLAACQGFRVSGIVFGAPDLRLGAVETHMRLLDVPHPFHNITTVIKGVRADESARLMQDFFRKRRKETKKKRKRSVTL
jgi:tRNA(adenine34) deaminase